MADANQCRFMKNGAPYEIHPCIEPDLEFTPERWKEETREGLKRMSARSRWHRFAAGVNELSESQLDYLTDVDCKDRVAWCAVIKRDGRYGGIGVSRYVLLQEEDDVAEFAVTVIDEFQEQGVGRALLEQLVRSAWENEVRVLRGYVFRDNGRMLALAKRMGGASSLEEAFVRIEIPVK